MGYARAAILSTPAYFNGTVYSAAARPATLKGFAILKAPRFGPDHPPRQSRQTRQFT